MRYPVAAESRHGFGRMFMTEPQCTFQHANHHRDECACQKNMMNQPCGEAFAAEGDPWFSPIRVAYKVWRTHSVQPEGVIRQDTQGSSGDDC